jgi:hypothetical protein
MKKFRALNVQKYQSGETIKSKLLDKTMKMKRIKWIKQLDLQGEKFINLIKFFSQNKHKKIFMKA